MFYQVFAIILSESGQWSGYLYNPLLWRRSSITRRCAGSKSSSALGNDISTSRCHHNAIESSSTRNPRALTSTATSATASLTNTCQMRPPPLCFPSVTKLSDIGHSCRQAGLQTGLRFFSQNTENRTSRLESQLAATSDGPTSAV